MKDSIIHFGEKERCFNTNVKEGDLERQKTVTQIGIVSKQID